MISRHIQRMTDAVRRRKEAVRLAMNDDAGYSVTEWAIITAVGGGVALAVGAAINTVTDGKITQILGF